MEITDEDTEETAKFLWTIANRISTTYPAVSRYYMSSLKKMKETKIKKQEVKPHKYCKHCGSLWVPGNHKVNLLPLPSLKNHMKKLLKIEKEEPWKLNQKHKKKLKELKNSQSKLVYTCMVCHKKTSFPGCKKFKEKKVVISAPKLKVKPKKGDLNAGLFIPITVKQDEETTLKIAPEERTESTASKDEKEQFQETIRLSNLKETAVAIGKASAASFSLYRAKPNPPAKNGEKLAKKRQKSLLAQITRLEQGKKKKKSGLASFLLSL